MRAVTETWDKTGGGEATGACYVIFYSLLCSFLPLTLLLLIVYVRQQTGRERGDATGPTWAATATNLCRRGL